MTFSFNRFKSSTVYGAFRVEDDNLSLISSNASAYISRDLEVTGKIINSGLTDRLVDLEEADIGINGRLDDLEDADIGITSRINDLEDLTGINNIAGVSNLTGRITDLEGADIVTDNAISDIENQITQIRQITDLITYDDSNPLKIELDFDRTDVKTLTIDDRLDMTASSIFDCPGRAQFEGLLTFNPDPGHELSIDDNSSKIPNTSWIQTRINTDLQVLNDSIIGLLNNLQTTLEGADTTLANRIQTNENTIVDLESADTALGNRIQTNENAIIDLESADTALGNRIQTNENAIIDLELADTALSGRIQTNEDNITDLESADTALGNRIQTNENAIIDLELADTALSGRIQTNEDNITDLTTRLEKLENLLKNCSNNSNSGNPDVFKINSELRVEKDVKLRKDCEINGKLDVDDKIRIKTSGNYKEIENYIGDYFDF